MDLTQLANLGEFVGGVAVLLTLIYLAAQIRQNTRSVEAAALDSSANILSAVRQSVYENSEVAHIYHAGMADPDQLSEEERLRFRLLVHNVFFALLNSYKQGRLTGSSDQSIGAIAPLLQRLLPTPGYSWFWTHFKNEFDPTFRAEVDQLHEYDRPLKTSRTPESG